VQYDDQQNFTRSLSLLSLGSKQLFIIFPLEKNYWIGTSRKH